MAATVTIAILGTATLMIDLSRYTNKSTAMGELVTDVTELVRAVTMALSPPFGIKARYTGLLPLLLLYSYVQGGR
jgi:hypothetical protein